MDKHYKKYKGIIVKAACRWNKVLKIEIDDLVGEGNVVYVKCMAAYSCEKSKFSTFLTFSLNAHFKNLIKKNNNKKYDGIQVELNGTIPSVNHQEQLCVFKSVINSLSREAKEIVSIVLNAPADLLNMMPKPELSKHQLTEYLTTKGWKKPIIKKKYNEIQSIL